MTLIVPLTLAYLKAWELALYVFNVGGVVDEVEVVARRTRRDRNNWVSYGILVYAY